MKIQFALLAGLWLLLAPLWAESPGSAPSTSTPANSGGQNQFCEGQTAAQCGVSKQDFQIARKAFERGRKISEKNPEEALRAFDTALRLVPGSRQYISARAILVQSLVYRHLQRGNELMAREQREKAATEFRRGLELDPDNQFVQTRLQDAGAKPASGAAAYSEPDPEQREIMLQPRPGRQSFHLTGNAQAAFTTIGAAFGITVRFSGSAPDKSLRLDLEQTPFEQAMNAVAMVTHSFWTPLSPQEVIVGADTRGERKDLERWLLREYRLSDVLVPQELSDIAGLLRTLFDLQKVTTSPAERTITMRGPASMVHAATQYLDMLWPAQPQVMLQFDVYEITQQMLQEVGINTPANFTLFPLTQSASAVLGNAGLQALLGGGSAASGVSSSSGLTLAALVTQSQSQNATFLANAVPVLGGGSTRLGAYVPAATVAYSKNYSRAISLSSVSMRSLQGNATLFRLGTRYPVTTGVYSGAATSIGALPTITYEDLGLTIKATPAIHKDNVGLQLQIDLAALGAQLINSIPTISNRSYQGEIQVRNDEPAVVAVSVTQSELRSLQNIAGIGRLPVLGSLTGVKSTEEDKEEVLIVITPHILTKSPAGQSTQLLLPKN